MQNHVVQFEFVGFNPESDIRSCISAVADRIHSLSPSDSFMKVAMRKSSNTIQTSCRTASKAGTFTAETVCHCPKIAIQKIEKKIMYQLGEWKKQRFAKGVPKARLSRPKLERAI